MVRWQDLSLAQRDEVENLKITDQQIEYAGPTLRAVETCKSDETGDVLGAAIFNGDAIAGFLVLKRRSTAPQWALEGSAVVSALRVDLRFQGIGIGTAALRLLPNWLSSHWSDTTSIMLSVDEDNAAGRRSYANAGWLDMGIRDVGRIGWVRYMTLDLNGRSLAPD